MESAPTTVVETRFFLRKAAGLLAEDERLRLIAFVGANLGAGGVIPEGGAVRKVRWAAKGRGKRAGIRVVTTFMTKRFRYPC